LAENTSNKADVTVYDQRIAFRNRNALATAGKAIKQFIVVSQCANHASLAPQETPHFSSRETNRRTASSPFINASIPTNQPAAMPVNSVKFVVLLGLLLAITAIAALPYNTGS
jgi:hypothetical protein